MDNRSKEARSRNMSNIPSKNTKPEETVRKYMFAQGFRYRKNVSKLPGKPDIVLPKYKTAVFININAVYFVGIQTMGKSEILSFSLKKFA